MTSQSTTRTLSVLVLVAVFTSGILLGVALDRRSPETAVPADSVAAADTSESDGGEGRRRPLMIDQVDMSAEQRAAIDSIVEAGFARIREVGEQYEEAYDEERARIILSIREDIVAVLTPEQAAEYERIRRERMEERRRRNQANQESSNR